MATQTTNTLALIAKPITSDIVARWQSVDAMTCVIDTVDLQNGSLSGNSIRYDRVCFAVDCRDVAGFVLIETDDNDSCFRYSQFPVTPGTWCTIDGQFCIDPCLDVIDDTCVVEEKKTPARIIDWCQRAIDLQCRLDEYYFEDQKTSLSGHGRSYTMKAMDKAWCDKMEQEIRRAENKCRACRCVVSGGRRMVRLADRLFK